MPSFRFITMAARVLRMGTGARLSAREVIPFRERRTFVERNRTVRGITGIISGFLITIVTVSSLSRPRRSCSVRYTGGPAARQ